ncbi:MAG: cation:proton antiporter [Candidatus Micrarchaeota archaeon]
MEGSAILDFGWVLLFAAIAGMLSVRLRLPPVAGLLIAGMIMGPNVLHLVSLPTIETFAEIGAVLLLFMIGVEFSVAKLLSTGLRAVMSSLLLILSTFTFMHELAILLGLDPLTSLFVGAMFSMSSTAIMMKLLEQKGLVGRQEVPILITILIIEDIIAVFMLTFFSSLKTGAYTAESVFGAVVVSLAILSFGYIILQKLLNRFAIIFLRYQAEDTLILFSFTLGIGMSIAASLLGLTPAIGAFMAGSIIAGLPNGRDFEHAIRPFSHVFSSFFFLSVGMLINPVALLAHAELAAVLIGGFMVIVFLATTFSFFLISSSGRSSVFAGIAMLPLGEFSLLIAKESVGVIQTDIVGIASAGVLVTSIAGSIALGRTEHAYLRIKKTLPPKFLDTLRDASGYFMSVLSTFEPGGYFHNLFVSELKRLTADILYLLGASIFYLAARPFLGFHVEFSGSTFSADMGLLVLLALISLVPLAKLLESLKKLFDALSTIFSRTTPQASKGAIARNLAIAALLFLLFANTYLVVELLELPRIFNWISPLFGIMCVFFLWSAVRASTLWFILTGKRPAGIMGQKIVAAEDDLIIVGEGPKKEEPEKAEQKKKEEKNRGKRKVVFLR